MDSTQNVSKRSSSGTSGTRRRVRVAPANSGGARKSSRSGSSRRSGGAGSAKGSTNRGGNNKGRRSGGRSGQKRGRGGSRGGGRRMRDLSKNWRKAPMVKKGEETTDILPPTGDRLRIAVMGGAEEVGRNMTMVEYGDDIILIDCGLQFPEEDMPGVDYIIPDVSYFKGKEKNVKGIIITHAHYDHIGGIPHIAPLLHNPPIFSARLSLGIIAKRQDDFPDKPALDLREVDVDGQLQLGAFTVEFVRINHSIPDSLAIVVRTPEGIVLHTGDFKFDLEPINDEVTDFAKLSRLGKEGVLALLADSTNASKPGQQQSESHIGRTILDVMSKAPGRIIVGTFASNLNRVQQLLWSAEALNRKVVLEGYSMRTNVEIAKQLGYLTVRDDTIIPGNQAVKLPPEKLIIVGTGAQGEPGASMMRMATGDHRFFNIERGDTVIFSSSVIPGNERSVQKLKDMLIREGAHIVHYQMMDVHAGGHAQQEDLKLLLRMINPDYYVPVEGNTHLLDDNGRVAKGLGWPEDHVFITSNGQIMEFKGGKGQLTKEKAPSEYVFVDGLGVGDVSEVVLRDRQALAEDGMLIVIVTVDSHGAKLVGEPDIISRGFIYTKGNAAFVEDTRKKVAEIVKPHMVGETPNPTHLKNKLRDELGQFLFQRIQRRPMILPVVVEV